MTNEEIEQKVNTLIKVVKIVEQRILANFYYDHEKSSNQDIINALFRRKLNE